jgi:hypothetical protein
MIIHDTNANSVYPHPIPFDDVAGCPVSISFEHHEVHGGDSYIFTDENASLGDGSSLQYLISVGSTGAPHMIFDVVGALETVVEVYEGSTHNRGSMLSVFNRNRNSSNVNVTKIHNIGGFVANGNGTRIFINRFGIDVGGGVNRVTGGGEDRSQSEWILKKDTVYLLKVTSQTASNVVSVKMEWYEHDSTY